MKIALRGVCRSFLLVCLVAGTMPLAGEAQTLDRTTRLAALGQVWGLLKYFHPQVAEGTIDWDAALVARIRRVSAVDSKAAFNEEIREFIREAGSPARPPATAPVDQPESDPAFAWIDDGEVFERSTIDGLKAVRHGSVSAANRFVRSTPNVGNPDFIGDLPHDVPVNPDAEMRLLALFRYWNVVQYYSPNRDVTDRPWSEVLAAYVPQFLAATDATQYHLAVGELTTNLNDAHAVTTSPILIDHWGINEAPIRTRFIESQTVVTRIFGRLAAGADVRPGDVVTDVNGVPAAQVRDRIRRVAWGSNEGSVERTINSLMLRTRSSTITLGISRSGVRRSVTMNTSSVASLFTEEQTEDARLEVWKILPGNIGYVHMGLLRQPDVSTMMAALRDTRAIVFDVRNYPQSTLYLIAQYLNDGPREFVKFTKPRYDRPGTTEWTLPLSAGPPRPATPQYRGRVVLLGDDRTQSHAEFTMMALRTAPNVRVVGTPTAGADGNVSLVRLPGGLRTYISGLGVFYPDGRPTQRVGIEPDVVAAPTIAGVQNGIDEVLEVALALLER